VHMNPTLGNLGSLEDPVSWFPVRKRAAFFDVDHTLVSGSTIRGFFDHFKRQVDDPHLLDAIRDLEKRSVTYTDHGALIVDCFRLLAGQNWENMMDIGQSWFQEFGQHTFVPAIEARVAQHRNNEDVIVFVSGSWMPCLKPIAQAVGAHHVLL
jgi:phosphoserine phosphatase